MSVWSGETRSARVNVTGPIRFVMNKESGADSARASANARDNLSFPRLHQLPPFDSLTRRYPVSGSPRAKA